MVISSKFYKSSWDDTLLIILLILMIPALVKLINNYTEKTKKNYFYAYDQVS
jgi:hypothetical protein